MGAQLFFDENVPGGGSGGRAKACALAELDNHSVPEIRIGPPGEAFRGLSAAFLDWEQFCRFVAAVNSIHARLEQIPR